MRLEWIGIILCGVASSAFAQALPESLRACAAETDSLRRLSCYDREVGRLSEPGTAHTGVPPPLATPAQLAPAPEFGLDEERVRKLKVQPHTAEPKSLTARITAVSQLPYGRQRLALDNAQVWDQTEEDWGFAPQSGAVVTISRGTLGGFWMTTDGHRIVRVKRIH